MKKDTITKTKLRELSKEFNLKFYETEDDYVYIDFKDSGVITDDCGNESSLIEYGGQDYVFAKAGFQLWYDGMENSMKLIWDENDVPIETMKDLRKYCKNMTEQYELFKFYKKQFKQNTRIKKISKDFE